MNGTAELLEAAAKGNERACEQMLRDNSGLIWSIVRRYYGCGVEPDDLYQLGCLGFIKAVKGFDITFGTQFSTYAVPKIAGEIRRFLRDDGAIKVSRSLREQAAAIFSAREKLSATLGREPVLSELSEETGLSAEEIAQCELAVAAPESLQRETGDGLTLENVIGSGFFGEERDDIAYIWSNALDAERHIVDMDLTFFVRQDGDMYRRFTEKHRQRAHSADEMEKALLECGFADIRIYGDRTFDAPKPEELRLHFTAVRV